MTSNSLKKFLATTFLGGLVVILPLAIFAILANWILSLIGGVLNPIVSLFPEKWNHTLLKMAAFAVIVIICFLIGLLVKTQFGSSIFNWVEENWMAKLPFYSTIKETTQQLIGKDKTPFAKVVMVDPFGSGVKMIGFVTDEEPSTKRYTIFVPTAPNPTNGFVFVLKEEVIEFLDVRSEEAMRTIIGLGSGSAGIINKVKLLEDLIHKKDIDEVR
jgi:uncharacterized membrane protein